MPSAPTGLSQLRNRVARLFQDHEIFIRTHGHVRFLRISAAMQKRIAAAVLLVLFTWTAFTVSMLINQWLTADERATVAAKKAEAIAAEARIAQYRDRVAETAADLDERQAHIEDVLNQSFGADASALKDGTAKDAPAPEALKTSMFDPSLPPEAQALARIEARQEAFAARLLAAVNTRAAQAEMAVVKLGLNPKTLLQEAARSQGGPYVPYANSRRARAFGPAFAALDGALFRMEVLERTLVAIPSGNPADIMLMSSGFGFRHDPFTGAGAMHSGLDFKGPIGTPILAAAPGRVVTVGWLGGYGKTIEIDHGQGILTRYAHLSGFDAQVGDMVAPGQRIGRMGSTGRSTGSHLHFEVRINGTAVNPRRFLELNDDVLEVKADARERVAAVARSR